MKLTSLVVAPYAFAAFAGLWATNAAADNLLVNGDFESPLDWTSGVSYNAGYSAFVGSQIPGWTIESGHAVTIHNTNAYPYIAGAFSVNMDGEGYNGHNANLYQDFASTSGYQYQLSFDWQGWFNDSNPQLDVSIVDLSDDSVLYHGNFGYSSNLMQESASFHGTGNMLRLRVMESPESGYNDNAFIVDNFAVSVVAVPEPETYALFIAGLGLLGVVSRRQSRAVV
ncbi:MAG: DUF642 domain-containing protein [Betaproteobacteria bacterium]|nr:DUF642 domain-containing protein [Betaproteobacteria bacterium]